LKPRDATLQEEMKARIAQTKEYQDLPLTHMQESMRDAHNAGLAKSIDYALGCASAGTTPVCIALRS
jgi:hypothetical protein